MDALTTIAIAEASPLDEAADLLFARHTADMHADTPPESIHMLPREALAAPGISFYLLRVDDGAAAMGALKRSGSWGELKSMHVLSEYRGQGLSHRLLSHLIEVARAEGLARLYLETGAPPTFGAARALYARAGFVDCPPFGNYAPDPNSVFMTLPLAPADTPVQNRAGTAP
ncbi:GNAT family N-acetyltransferase [Paracoccus suum]|uniref:GNAT family N-acetyltransferase n=1 Tax=Paracoccus suum TaxID=2259340 RepID=UPI001F53EE5F|nr:GNAT family N-acetyltransferase [Paracoccus suum]